VTRAAPTLVPMAVRAVRGAIQVDRDDRDEVLDATTELLRTVLERNGLTQEDLISVVFTATPDLTSEFPAYAARQMGFVDVPLLCASEIDVAGAMPRVLRVLAHVETDLPRSQVQHAFLRGAAALRRDLPS
jgi:chorismate mutase